MKIDMGIVNRLRIDMCNSYYCKIIEFYTALDDGEKYQRKISFNDFEIADFESLSVNELVEKLYSVYIYFISKGFVIDVDDSMEFLKREFKKRLRKE